MFIILPLPAALKNAPGRHYPIAVMVNKDFKPPDLLHLLGASCPKMDRLGNDPYEVRERDL